MEKLLFINACMRENSRTMQLAKHVLSKWHGSVEELCLSNEQIPPLNPETLKAREKACAENDFSLPMFKYAHRLVQADAVLIAAPYWDLAFPAALKAYLEAVTVCGLTFCYTDKGIPAGLCKAKKLIYVTTAGGPVFEPDFGFDYIMTLAQGFYGIPEAVAFKAENLDIIGADVEGILEKTKAEIDKYEL